MSSITFEQRDANFFARMGWLLTVVGAGGFSCGPAWRRWTRGFRCRAP